MSESHSQNVSAMSEQQQAIHRLIDVMARLRDPIRGCEWDREQTFASIAPYTIEEAYEIADACNRGDMEDLKDELGDLLLQVVFHSRIAEEADAFTFDAVAQTIVGKMERRHPHIFGDATNGGHHLWEAIKAQERAGKADQSAIAGVALGLPALLRAEKLQKRAARVGFDWRDADGPRAKVLEEIAEVDEASPAEREEEIGDLLFAVVNWARHLNIDAEAALRTANTKFERRFRNMERIAGGSIDGRDLAAQEELWVAAKREERP